MAKAYNKKELENLAKDWDGASVEGETDLPDGKYHMGITDCKLILEPGKRRCAVSKLKVVGGDDGYVGETLTLFDGLETSDNIGYFKKKLSKAGIKIGKGVEGIEEAVEDFVGRCVEVQVRNKDGFTNWYVNKLVDADWKDSKNDSKSKDEDEDDDDDDVKTDDADDADDDDNQSREFMAQDELEELNEIKSKKLLAKYFDGIDMDKIPKKRKNKVLRFLVAVVEADELEAESEDVRSAAKALGLKVKSKDEDDDIEEAISEALEEMFE